MGTDYISAYIKCPYYKSTNKYCINCCDEFDKKTAYILSKVFRNMDSKKSHLKRFCCEEYKKCEIYKIIEKRIEQEKEA